MGRWRRAWPQVLRRVIQVSVVIFLVWAAMSSTWRNYKVAHNSGRLVGLMHGDIWEGLYRANGEVLSLWGEPFRASLDFVGVPWAATVFGIPIADPIMVAAHTIKTVSLNLELLAGLILPLLLVLLLGKIFCSYLCPMRLLFEVGQMLRGGLLRMGFSLPHRRSDRRLGGWVLLGGLVATIGASTAVWLYILPYVGVSTGAFLLVTTGTAAGLMTAAVGWLVVDIAFAPGYFCHNVCPQGFLLENLGRAAPFKLRKSKIEPCPKSCRSCTLACPYSLSPREETHTPACDSCGLCVSACPKQLLSRRFGPLLAGLLTLAALALPGGQAQAHHNKGLPHYGYYENYPQVPTEDHVVVQGDWEMGATIFNFQGYELRESSDTPNDVKFYVYLYDLKEDMNYLDAVEFEIRYDGAVVSRFSRQRVDEELVYSTRETLPETGDYELVGRLPDGTEVILEFYVDLHEGAIDWTLIAVLLFPVLMLFGLALTGRTRSGQIQRLKSKVAATKAAIVLLMGASLLPTTDANAAAPEPDPHAGHRMHEGMNHEGMNHEGMNHEGMNHEGMNHEGMNHEGMNHGAMGHGTMVHYETEAGEMVMVMGGIPPWLFVTGIALLILFSFVVVEWLGTRKKAGFRYNLIKNRKVYKLVQSRWFQAAPQLLTVAIFAYLIYAGLVGSRIKNITPTAVWTVWWGGLIFAIAVAGPIFCYVCPWDGLANLVSRLRPAKKVVPLSLDLTVPTWLRNLYPAIILFFILSWAELGLGVTSDPRATAYMGLGMAMMAIVGVLLFKGKAFCAYGCPVGRINGIYANFAPVEVRAKNTKVCRTCDTEDCLNGNDLGYACPTGISLKTVGDATHCTFCTECVKSCLRKNVAFNIRPFAVDLPQIPKPKLDEAWLAISLLALTLFHGFSMTTVWENHAPGSVSLLKWMQLTFGTSQVFNFTVAMLVAVAIPILLYWGSCKVAARMTRGSSAGLKAKDLFIHYAFSLLPVALFYHLAHNAMHFLMEAPGVIPLLSDPLGQGTDYFGTAEAHFGGMISSEALWYVQVALIVIGHLVGVFVAHKISRRIFPEKKMAIRSLIPMMVVMILISVSGLTLMVLDMNMRAGRM